MARQQGGFVENQFIQGLISEATGFNFPDKAVTSTWNTRYEKTGEVVRRLGMAYENDVMDVETLASGGACKSFLWRDAGAKGDQTFLVVQSGSRLLFFEPDTNGNFSGGAKDFFVPLVEYKAPQQTGNTSEKECSFAYGVGKLFVAHPYCDPFYISYDSDADDITVTRVTIYVRDTKGVDDGLAIGVHPKTLTNLHKYNLFNQGWYDQPTPTGNDDHNDVTPSPLTTWYKICGKAYGGYPSNGEAWWWFKTINKEGKQTLNKSSKGHKNFGNTEAPKGHYVMQAFDMDRSAASGISGLDRVTSNGARPACVAFFAGRVWWGGVNNENFFDTAYYSQIMEYPENAGKCYQKNDPTNESLSDLLDTDGGTIRVSGIGKITGFHVVGQALIIFGSNGVWTVTGSGADGTGFVATSFAINRISSTGMLQNTSLVDVMGKPFWWNLDGIWTIGSSEGGGGQSVQSLTMDTIKTYYQQTIPGPSRNFAQGAYNALKNTIQWLWRSDVAASVEDNYKYDRILEFNISTGSFQIFGWDIADQWVSSIFVATDITTTEETPDFVYANDGTTNVTDNELVNVTTNVVTGYNFSSAQYKYVINWAEGFVPEGTVALPPGGVTTEESAVDFSLPTLEDGNGDPAVGINDSLLADGKVANWTRQRLYQIIFGNADTGVPLIQLVTYDLTDNSIISTWNMSSDFTNVDPEFNAIGSFQLLQGSYDYFGRDVILMFYTDNNSLTDQKCALLDVDTQNVLAYHTVTLNASNIPYFFAPLLQKVDTNKWYAVQQNWDDTFNGGGFLDGLQSGKFSVMTLTLTASGHTGSIAETVTGAACMTSTDSTYRRSKAWSMYPNATSGVDIFCVRYNPVSENATNIIVDAATIPYPYTSPTNHGAVITYARPSSFYNCEHSIVKLMDGVKHLVISGIDMTDTGDKIKPFLLCYTYSTPSTQTFKYFNTIDMTETLNIEAADNAEGKNITFFSDHSHYYDFDTTWMNTHDEGTYTVAGSMYIPAYAWEENTAWPTVDEAVEMPLVMCLLDGDMYFFKDVGNWRYDTAVAYIDRVPVSGQYTSKTNLVSVNNDQWIVSRAHLTDPPNYGISISSIQNFGMETFCDPDAETVDYYYGVGTGFAEESDTTYYDWVARYGATAKDYESYFTSGAKIHGEGNKDQQLEYITVFTKHDDNGSAYMKIKWDWANAGSTGKWSGEQQMYPSTRSNRDVNRKKLLLRGQGPALQFHIRSQAGKPFNILGWSTSESVDAQT